MKTGAWTSTKKNALNRTSQRSIRLASLSSFLLGGRGYRCFFLWLSPHAFHPVSCGCKRGRIGKARKTEAGLGQGCCLWSRDIALCPVPGVLKTLARRGKKKWGKPCQEATTGCFFTKHKDEMLPRFWAGSFLSSTLGSKLRNHGTGGFPVRICGPIQCQVLT